MCVCVCVCVRERVMSVSGEVLRSTAGGTPPGWPQREI